MTASRMRTRGRTRPVEGPRIDDSKEYGPEYSQDPNPPKERLRRASTAKVRGYPEYLLEGVKERVEEEIAAMDFVRGAWREMRRKAGC